jgi:hypothetical protein
MAQQAAIHGAPSGVRSATRSTAPEVKLISHSNVFYWWPAWVAGYAVALLTSLQGRSIDIEPGIAERVHPSNNPGILFIAVVVLLVVFTTTKLRGIYSVLTVVTVGFFAVLFAWLGWWDDIMRIFPHLSARANIGFYLLFSTTLLFVWFLAVFVFDRLSIWRVRPGQMIEERLIGGSARSFDTNGLVFAKRSQDLFHDIILGLGAGDLTLTTSGPDKETIQIKNILLVDRKMAAIERMISVKPEQVRSQG